MKPAFALDLSQDGLALLYRLEDGWAELGRVAFDDPDLDARIAALRGRAETLAPGCVTTKLILPESQILYVEVTAPGPDSASRRAQIAAALEGRTPYPVEDLAFDWSRSGGVVQAAVLARVTLAEAESFAEAKGFNPVSFVARPAPGRFAGEPFFGLAAGAAAHLPEGARLDRDQDPVRVVALPPELATATVGKETAAHEEIQPSPPEEPELAAPEPAGLNIVAPESAEAAVSGPEPAPPEPESAVHGEIRPSTPEGPKQPAREPAESNIAAPEPAELAEPGPEPEAPEPEPAVWQAEAAPAGPDAGMDADAEAEAPFIALDDLADGEEDATATAVQPDAPPPPAPAFASRRLAGEPVEHPATLLAEATGRLHLLADEPGATAVRTTPKLGAATTTLGITAAEIDLPPSVTASGTNAQGGPQRRRLGRAILTALPETRHGTQAQLRERQAMRDAPPAGGATGPFGAPSRAARRATPSRARLGLVLVAALLLLMAAVALWSLWFGADPEPKTELPVASEPAAPELAAALPAIQPDAVPETPVAEVAAAPDPVAASPDAPADAVAAALAEALAPEADEAATSSPAAPPQSPGPVWTGIPEGSEMAAEDPAPGAGALAEVVEPDRARLPEQPAALAPAAATTVSDAEPEVQPLPPPFGTVITFGPDGRIVATPEGVITPEGFTLFAGQPPLVPAAAPRPGAAVSAPDAAVAAEATLPRLPAPADPAHAARRPLLRPEAVVARAAAARAAVPAPPATGPDPAATSPAAPETEGALPPPADPAHAALGPKVRPEAITRRAEAARAQAAAIAEAAEAAARAEAEALARASKLAVASSRRPSERPSGLAKAVEAAVAAAVASPPVPEPAATPAPEPAAAPAPEPASTPQPAEIDEPEPTETVPDMPTTVTVARQATVKNAIDLGKINLIGVYGSSANRRALIRMPTGRLVKVKIGDRLDGGQVAAIGDSELTYVKGGRSYTLKIQKNG